jgi:hypothetical protein
MLNRFRLSADIVLATPASANTAAPTITLDRGLAEPTPKHGR